jgi:hypothetical protein
VVFQASALPAVALGGVDEVFQSDPLLESGETDSELSSGRL